MPREDHERVRVHVSGRVQGVFFRESTREKAESLDLAGWARNLPDGRVEALFEGPSDKVREMIEWCESGPSGAGVEEVETSSEETGDDLTGFEVR